MELAMIEVNKLLIMGDTIIPVKAFGVKGSKLGFIIPVALLQIFPFPKV